MECHLRGGGGGEEGGGGASPQPFFFFFIPRGTMISTDYYLEIFITVHCVVSEEIEETVIEVAFYFIDSTSNNAVGGGRGRGEEKEGKRGGKGGGGARRISWNLLIQLGLSYRAQNVFIHHHK